MEYLIDPYVGVGPLTWDMGAQEVSQFLGVPSRHSRNRVGNHVEFRGDLMMSCIYDKSTGLLIEAGFSKTQRLVFFDGMDLMAPDASVVLRFLYQHDSTALEGFGSQVFPLLGISLTGYRPEEAEVRTVTAFARGRWDVQLPSMERLRLP